MSKLNIKHWAALFSCNCNLRSARTSKDGTIFHNDSKYVQEFCLMDYITAIHCNWLSMKGIQMTPHQIVPSGTWTNYNYGPEVST